MLSTNFKQFKLRGNKKMRCGHRCSESSYLRQSVTLRSSTRPHPVTLWTKLDVNDSRQTEISSISHFTWA